MRLHQGDTGHHLGHALGAWLLPIVVISISAVLEIWGESGREWLRYDRLAIADGEIWRLASGHFVHLGLPHLALNALGFALVWYLVASSFRAAQWLLVMLVTIAGIDLGFWLLQPQLTWYVGLSGLLHGVLAAGIVAGFSRDRHELWVLGVLLVGKIAFEQVFGPLPGSEDASGGAVITAAHLYGAITGAVAASVHAIRVRARTSI
jgi:rhomboid family GlyGly-CTERM serine protease